MIKTETEYQKKKTFPKLMINEFNDAIVLMTKVSSLHDTGTGICLVKGNSNYDIAEFRNDWDLKCFVDYEGNVTIFNTEE